MLDKFSWPYIYLCLHKRAVALLQIQRTKIPTNNHQFRLIRALLLFYILLGISNLKDISYALDDLDFAICHRQTSFDSIDLKLRIIVWHLIITIFRRTWYFEAPKKCAEPLV